jgi:hypothetical protein
MHVKNKHTDKYEEFKKNFDELKKTAVKRESSTRTEVKGPEPPKIEEKETPPELKDGMRYQSGNPPKDPEKKKDGDGESGKGGSFLDDINKWLDSPEF